MTGTTSGRRLAAGAALLVLLTAVTALVVGGLVVSVDALVGDTPAADQERTERAEVDVVRCGRDIDGLTAVVRVRNRSSATSTYYIDVAFRRRATGEVLATVPTVVDALAADGLTRTAVSSPRSPRGRIDCAVADVDRLLA